MKTTALFIPVLLIAACATGLTKRDALPTDVTQMKSMQYRCATTIYVENGFATRPGETTVIELSDRREFDWECLADPAADKDHLVCPAGARFLQVGHTGRGGRFTVACFG